jgi:hypothetical protein
VVGHIYYGRELIVVKYSYIWEDADVGVIAEVQDGEDHGLIYVE